MAEVYWIRKATHTDIFTQGYVGVTSKTAEERFKAHELLSRRERVGQSKSVVHKEMASSTDIILEVVLICGEDYAYEVEANLRPTKNIGWNVAQGGYKLQSRSGIPHTQQARDKISKSHMGKKIPTEVTNKRVNTIISNGPWNRKDADPTTWALADTFYNDYLEGLTYHFCAKKHSIMRTKITSIYKWFEKGWVPSEDINWTNKFMKQEL